MTEHHLHRPPPSKRDKNPAAPAAIVQPVVQQPVAVGAMPATPRVSNPSGNGNGEKRKFYTELIVTTAVSAAVSTIVGTLIGTWISHRIEAKRRQANPDRPEDWTKRIVLEGALSKTATGDMRTASERMKAAINTEKGVGS